MFIKTVNEEQTNLIKQKFYEIILQALYEAHDELCEAEEAGCVVSSEAFDLVDVQESLGVTLKEMQLDLIFDSQYNSKASWYNKGFCLIYCDLEELYYATCSNETIEEDLEECEEHIKITHDDYYRAWMNEAEEEWRQYCEQFSKKVDTVPFASDKDYFYDYDFTSSIYLESYPKWKEVMESKVIY